MMRRQIHLYFFILLAIFPIVGYADITNMTDFSNWLSNIVLQIPNIRAFVVAVAYVSGIGFVISAVMKLKVVAQSSSSMMQQQSISGPLVYFVVGVVLIYVAGFVNVGAATVFGANVAYQYNTISGSTSFNSIIAPVIQIVKLLGLIAFVKGIFILARLGQQSQQGTLSKGLTHIIGGVLAMNIEATYTIIFNTLQGT